MQTVARNPVASWLNILQIYWCLEKPVNLTMNPFSVLPTEDFHLESLRHVFKYQISDATHHDLKKLDDIRDNHACMGFVNRDGRPVSFCTMKYPHGFILILS